MIKTYEKLMGKVFAEDIRIGIWLSSAPKSVIKTYAHAYGPGPLERLRPRDDVVYQSLESFCGIVTTADAPRLARARRAKSKATASTARGVASCEKCDKFEHTAALCQSDSVRTLSADYANVHDQGGAGGYVGATPILVTRSTDGWISSYMVPGDADLHAALCMDAEMVGTGANAVVFWSDQELHGPADAGAKAVKDKVRTVLSATNASCGPM